MKFAGGTVGEDYGYHVIIDHGGGMETYYAHLDQVSVQEGQVVRQGEFLGLGGDTGKAQGKHLHFEIRTNGSQINPLEVLPEQGASRPEPLKMDCAREALVIDSGAPVFLDFSGALPLGSRIQDAKLESVNTSPQALPAIAEIESDASVLVDTSPTVTGTGNDDEYALKLTARVAGADAEMVCSIFVRTHTTRTVFYVRPTQHAYADRPGRRAADLDADADQHANANADSDQDAGADAATEQTSAGLTAYGHAGALGQPALSQRGGISAGSGSPAGTWCLRRRSG